MMGCGFDSIPLDLILDCFYFFPVRESFRLLLLKDDDDDMCVSECLNGALLLLNVRGVILDYRLQFNWKCGCECKCGCGADSNNLAGPAKIAEKQKKIVPYKRKQKREKLFKNSLGKGWNFELGENQKTGKTAKPTKHGENFGKPKKMGRCVREC